VFKLGDPFEMGFEVDDDPDRVCFSKLFLDPDQVSKGQQLVNFTALAGEHNASQLIEGVTKYLASLRKRAIEHMEGTWDKGDSGPFILKIS
jgi:hypothetical protein